jgi:multidrug efflux pump
MFSHFFIDRPIFATVMSLAVTLVGAVSLFLLPLAQYPRITPPAVQVSISYPGANAQTVADTVAAPIEQQVNGVPGMLYMSSQSGNDGTYSLQVTFDVNTDLNTALVMVQNRVTLAMPLLPTPVQNQGITIRKRTPDILLIVSMYSPDQRYDDLYLSNYALINLRDELLRVDGVSDVFMAGERDYSIRVWLDPQLLASRNISANDVVRAIRAQSTEAALGQVGQPPVGSDQLYQLPIDALGRLSEPEQFAEIVVKTGQRGQQALPRLAGPPRANLALPGAGLVDPLQVVAGQSASSSANGSSISGTTSTANSTSSTTSTNSTSDTTTTSVTTAGPSIQGGATTGGGATAIGGASMSTGTTDNSALTSSALSANEAAAIATTPSESLFTTNGTTDIAADASLAGLAINTAALLGQSTPAAATTGLSPLAPALVRLGDIARIEMGAQNYNQGSTFDGRPSVGLIVYQLPGTNAIDVANRVHARMKELSRWFPDGVSYEIAYDTTRFIRESIADVVQTLLIAVVIVAAVVLAFLQSWRAVLIPLAAVPVAIVGTFAIMALAGFSLNNISLFGLVLAIGIVVDDAIVVVENVERWLDEGLAPREATRKAMDEVTVPVVAIALVLCTVFVPCAFISGITGRFFREFAVTIAVSTVLSALNSLTLSPALAAILLRPRESNEQHARRPVRRTIGAVVRLLNKAFSAATFGYEWAVGKLLWASLLVLVAYAGLLVATVWAFQRAPTGFVPQQDQGRIIVSLQLPDSASLERTRAALKTVDRIAHEEEGVAHTIAVAGMSFVQQATGSNFASIFVTLQPFEKRRDKRLSDGAIIARLGRRWKREVLGAQVLAFSAPPVPGLSVAGGFKIMVEDKSALGLNVLQQQTDALVARLQQEPQLAGVTTQFRSRIPQLYMDIDRAKLQALGVSFDEAFPAVQIFLGSLYVNSFNKYGRHWQVNVLSEGKFRSQPDKINLFQVRNHAGQMMPLGTVVQMRETSGPIFVTRYNLATAAPITGSIRPGVSSGDAITATEAAARETLPRTMSTEWTELMFMQVKEGNTAIYVFALAVLCVFLTLAALYESWTLPMAVILVVPLCLLSSLIGVFAARDAVNIFVQIGLVVLVGLACKNAILIVEFARELHRDGRPVHEATTHAARLRLRPILMTSLAFILGVVPLVMAHGAGSEMRRSLGTAVFSGMLGVTIFGVFLTPVFFYVIQSIGEIRSFAQDRVRWLWSYVLGVSLGAAAGFLLSRLGVVQLAWSVGIGAVAGAIVIRAIEALKRRVRPKR